MKKFLVFLIVSTMVIALVISASARYSLDRLYVNQRDRIAGEQEGQAGEPVNGYYGKPRGDKICIQPGDKLYIIGWAANESGLDKIVYTIDGGEEIECTGAYKDRPDVANAFGFDNSAGIGAGFGYDSYEEGNAAKPGMMEMTGIDQLPVGIYNIVIKAKFKDGTEEVFNDIAWGNGVFKLFIGINADDSDEETIRDETSNNEEDRFKIIIDGGIDKKYANPGDIVEVKILFKNNITISSAKMTIKFDEKLSVIKSSDGTPDVTFGIYDPNDKTSIKSATLDKNNNSILLGWITAENEVTQKDLVYATILFKVSNDAKKGAFLPITASINPYDVFDNKQVNIDFDLINGGIDIVGNNEDTSNEDSNVYTILFLDYDGSILSQRTYHYGNKVIEPTAISRESDETFIYKFKGWNKTVTICKGNAEYIAVYESEYIDYSIVFRDYDGYVLNRRMYHYGDKVIEPENPKRESDEEYKYIFAGWNKEVSTCTGNMEYIATYNKIEIKTKLGDINNDNDINNKDAVMLFRLVSSGELHDYETSNDFNSDGTVDNKDVVALFRYVSTTK